MARKSSEEKAPPGGWLGPPPTEGLAPIAVMGSNGKMKPVKLTPKQEEKHAKFRKKMAKADAKDEWRF